MLKLNDLEQKLWKYHSNNLNTSYVEVKQSYLRSFIKYDKI